ncbi:hypothetical protein AA309_17380 [Microvirga vignae]|uniref:AbiJ-NTD3 domain-containing protein n=1 Tax=Microvirga vignae TaxID=1225564 RepID=A0A0H1RA06_9HYPH|nr:hypothetical protein [Microvirga vignae]KLK91879.1 hypothetical protein AA309_17380 [Microvirga vignae]
MLNPGNNALALRIAETLKNRCTHETLPGAAEDAGFSLGEAVSKRDRVLAGLKTADRKTLGAIAQRIGTRFADFNLEETGCLVLEEGEPPITEITRRDIAKAFGHDLAGERLIDEVLKPLWPIDSMGVGFISGRSLTQQIVQHMVLNPTDWDAEQLFGELGAFTCSRSRFARLLEAVMHPLARRGAEAQRLASELNEILRRDGYRLEFSGEASGYPGYGLSRLHRGVAGAPKNLIFASTGPKPELGFADAVNNDIVILAGAEHCLVFDRPISRHGLLWSELVGWWSEQQPDERDAAKSLGLRLRASLASLGEQGLFDTYFRRYRPMLESALPALVPQVYLHYDPAVVRALKHRASFPRQRMDFLLLLPNRARVVIEVDGQHHFSRNDRPSLPAYAEMVSADRDLRLAGYEIYRFGANELVGAGAQALIERFFDRLFQLHGVGSTGTAAPPHVGSEASR